MVNVARTEGFNIQHSTFRIPPDVVARVWAGDHTLWSDDPTEIADRLGWLDTPSSMLGSVDDLVAFAREVRDEGMRHVVLLGMGGSSLGAEALRQALSYSSTVHPHPLPGGEGTFTSDSSAGEGWPELIVLDSTVPARIASVLESIDPARTLFLVSSKSGTTVEPNMLYKLFRSVVERAAGAESAGDRFVAITDAGTALDELARRSGFRRVFRNRPDIGGRYSVLSYFGLVPAALIGFDVRGLLNSAVAMQTACGQGEWRVISGEGRGLATHHSSLATRAASTNPGAWFGAVLGSLALAGRDKLTILTSPSLSSFGLWAEQLVAESLGKNGKGIVPIVGEPVDALGAVGDDRLFVSLELAGEDSGLGALADRLVSDGRPLVRYRIDDVGDLGGEFYRWEFAIAVSGAVIGVHPFDQPDVQRAKDLTDKALARFERDGEAPSLESGEWIVISGGERGLATHHSSLATRAALSDLIASMKAGNYLAILAYLEQTPDMDAALAGLRSAIASKYGIPTTLGYGPRYLHSTGQLHKGGANNVAALMLTAPHAQDIEIPGEKFSFGVLADAQASSDLEALRSGGRNAVAVVLNEAVASVEELISSVTG